MKKIITILVSITFLAACGSESDELDEFATDFNEFSETREVSKINNEDFGEVEVEDGRGWQSLYESNEYTIDAKYEDGENLSGYYLVINESNSFELQSGEGYWAGVTIARALDLDSSNYMDAFLEALNKTSHSYTDNDYIVSFTNPGEDRLTSTGMIINFDKR